MRKNLFLRLFLLIAFSILLYSCIHDEIVSSTDPPSKDYQSKSLWEENVKYIKNVMKIYEKNEATIKKTNGAPLWEYAMTVGNMDESFLIVPIGEGNKIVSVLSVPRIKSKVYFRYSDKADYVNFFQKYIDAPRKKTLDTEGISLSSRMECNTHTASVWYPDDESNPDPGSPGHWGAITITVCKPIKELSDCYKDVFGNCITEGGDGYPYPDVGGGGSQNPEPPEDPCVKIKSKFENTRFKEKIAAIDKPEVFNYDHEMGYAAGYPPSNTGITETQYPPMENVLGTHNVTLPPGNQYFGFIHSHNNESDGGHPVKIFSPGDLATFLTSCVANADTHGSITDAYAMVVTSEGNYILQFTGSSSGFGIGPNTRGFWNLWYKREAIAIQNEDGTIDQDKVEKMFLRFLKEKVGIDGVELYQVEKITGKAKKLTLDVNNNVIPNPCP